MTAPAPETCDECGASPVELVLYPVAIHYKGSGFYTTDYGSRKRSKESSESDSSKDSKPEGKSDSKSESKSDSKSDSKSETKAAASSSSD